MLVLARLGVSEDKLGNGMLVLPPGWRWEAGTIRQGSEEKDVHVPVPYTALGDSLTEIFRAVLSYLAFERETE